jgi:hypothetical protein
MVALPELHAKKSREKDSCPLTAAPLPDSIGIREWLAVPLLVAR